jgi:hypothetical protein
VCALPWLLFGCASSAQGANAAAEPTSGSELDSDQPAAPSSSDTTPETVAAGAEEPSAIATTSDAKPSEPTAPASEPGGGKKSDKGKGDKGKPASGGEHCPSGMLFVQGEYCSEVEHKCLKQWHSDANNKDICENFEPYSKCVGKKTPKAFCIDDFTWPNKAGERAEVMNNFYQAQVKCAAIGKRLCTESEWTMACEGPEMKPFPYGYKRDPNICNGDREWDRPNMNKVAKRDPSELARLWQGVRAGSQPGCVSDYGVHDLPGNDDEVASSETRSSNFRGKFDSVTTGGPWYKGVRNQCRPKIYTHNEGFYYYYLGFRCCSEPDGAVTDPRAPKQIERKMDFSRVEALARFSVKEMQQKLELKAKGACTCKDTDALCKTMCGTLLGPEAKDAPARPSTPAQP